MPFGSTTILLFVIAAAVAVTARRLRLPYTVALVIAGLVLGSARVMNTPVLTKELMFAVFLPGLLFEAAYHIEFDDFWRNRVPIFALALPGVVGATLVTAAGLVMGTRALGFANGIAWAPAFVFATLITATDPIAVVSLVRTLGAPKRLSLLIEGESLLNDGTAAVALAATVAYVMGAAPETASVFIDVVYAIGVGTIIGAVLGLVAARAVAWAGDAMIMITVTTTVAYGAFFLAEGVHGSGVIASVTAGLLCGNRGTQRDISPSMRTAVATFWEYLAFALNSLVFLLIGFQARIPLLLANWRLILFAYVVVTVGRAIVTYTLAAVLPKRDRLPARWTAVLTWSGLRGSLAMVLALSLPAALPQRDSVIAMTIGVVVLSILVQGLTVSPLLRWLGMASARASRAAYEQAQAQLMAARAALEELEHMQTVHVVAPHIHAALSAEYAERVSAAETQVKALHQQAQTVPEAELDRVRRHLLAVERDQVLDAFRLGALSDVARDQMIADIDARWAQSELRVVTSIERDRSAPSDAAELAAGESAAR